MAARFRPESPRDRLMVALDVASTAAAERLVERLGDTVGFYKVGMQLAFAGGLALVPALVAAGKRVFLDMKLLDIDNTVASGVKSIDGMGVTLTTIHAYPKAMRAAASARGAQSGLGLLAVTVLTSLDDRDLAEAGYAATARDLVLRRAADAKAAGMDGIVCSAQEAASVRAVGGPGMLIVTPGIRPAGAAADDQKRVMTAADAIAAGADCLVVGRPIVAAPDPEAAARAMLAEIEAACRGRR